MKPEELQEMRRQIESLATEGHISGYHRALFHDAVNEIERLRGALVEIREYWNGSDNYTAMLDALMAIDDIAGRVLDGDK